MLIKKKYLKENVAVWCDTLEQAKVLLSELGKLDYEWQSGDKPNKQVYFTERGTMYFIRTNKELTYCRSKDYRSNNTHVYIDFMDIIKSITEEEKEILEKGQAEGYSFISRNQSGLLYLSDKKPEKRAETWCASFVRWMNVDSDLFKMVKWKDNKPKMICKLLRYYIEEDNKPINPFKIGDLVTGNDENEYSCTTQGELMEVVDVYEASLEDLRVRMISGTESGKSFDVESKFFTKVDPENIRMVA